MHASVQFTWMQERVNDYLLWRCQHTHIQMTKKKDISLDLCFSHVSLVLIFPMGLTFITPHKHVLLTSLLAPPPLLLLLASNTNYWEISPPIMSISSSKLICTTHYTSTMIWLTYFFKNPNIQNIQQKLLGIWIGID